MVAFFELIYVIYCIDNILFLNKIINNKKYNKKYRVNLLKITIDFKITSIDKILQKMVKYYNS